MNAYTGVKVFSATMIRERLMLGEDVTDWLAHMSKRPDFEVADVDVLQSSDSSFHCTTVVLFYRERLPGTLKTSEGTSVPPTIGLTGMKVFSVTMAKERQVLGEDVTRWLESMRGRPGFEVLDTKVRQSSDSSYHCTTVVILYREQPPSISKPRSAVGAGAPIKDRR